MTIKTVVITGATATWTVPADFVSLAAVHAIGGGCCGSPGFMGAVSLENLTTIDALEGAVAGPGGYYLRTDVTPPTVPLVPGQVLALHVAAASAPVPILEDWRNDYFGSPPLSDDTWLQDNGGNYIVYAPGGDSSASSVGDVEVAGGDGFGPGDVNYVSGRGGGGAGGPAGEAEFQTGSGGSPTFIDPTAIREFGSGGGDGNLPNSTGTGARGTRLVAGAGANSGNPSGGGDGGLITGAAAATSSSLLLPSLDNPSLALDGVKTSAGFLFGAGDFTVELWYQAPIANPAFGVALSVWDAGTNQRSWAMTLGGSGRGYNDWVRSTDGITALYGGGALFPLFGPNTTLQARYTGFSYYGPYGNGLGWTHIAVCREGGVLRMFIDGYPSITNIGAGGVINYTMPDANNYFASNAHLTIGASLLNGAIDNTGDADGNFYQRPGWYGNIRITIGPARYTCPATSAIGAPPSFGALGQQFALPVGPLVGGDFNCNWPGVKGATASVAAGAVLTFAGAAQIDSDQYCYPPAVAEIGTAGTVGQTGAALWTDSLTAATAGPGGGGGGGGGDLARYRMKAGGAGGAGGNYGAGGGQGGGVNAGLYVDLGDAAAAIGIGGAGAPGALVIQYNVAATGLLAIAQVLG